MLLRKPKESKDNLIKFKDLVVAYVNPMQMKTVQVTEDNTFFDAGPGRYYPKEWAGLPYGIDVYPKKISNKKTMPLFLLKPTPELWTKVLRHRTQIIYTMDLSMICSMLELEPGSIVLESGTGSASASHSFIRAIAPTGQLFTFDFHKHRVDQAFKDFEMNNLLENVTVTDRDIENNGFPEIFKNTVDAVFLDLPSPWKAIESAFDSLKIGGNLCSFSPCVEQVQSTMRVIRKLSFIRVQVMECLAEEFIHSKRKYHHVQFSTQTAAVEDNKSSSDSDKNETIEMHTFASSEMKGHTGYLIFAKKMSGRKMNTRNKTAEVKGEVKREEEDQEI